MTTTTIRVTGKVEAASEEAAEDLAYAVLARCCDSHVLCQATALGKRQYRIRFDLMWSDNPKPEIERQFAQLPDNFKVKIETA